ncbi:hypothetical protein CCHR01_11149 [Colletotrichum chrysophilum]|uniref:Uncharacterized protein n=1 Tax=Colletotrichum chrysophilum TaxID=1836956 RepID=A0AAD9EF97_9PEZI|nr:hypothetical protein CCHR01_11149 [Colletotrichum chrysophilum]
MKDVTNLRLCVPVSQGHTSTESGLGCRLHSQGEPLVDDVASRLSPTYRYTMHHRTPQPSLSDPAAACLLSAITYEYCLPSTVMDAPTVDTIVTGERRCNAS